MYLRISLKRHSKALNRGNVRLVLMAHMRSKIYGIIILFKTLLIIVL